MGVGDSNSGLYESTHIFNEFSAKGCKIKVKLVKLKIRGCNKKFLNKAKNNKLV